jgi:nucleoside-diphosphate-sugar epimerase
MATVFVTGASGFIGSHVIRLLVKSSVEVHALVRPASDLCRLEDVRDSPFLHLVRAELNDRVELASQLEAIRPDVCIHLAWTPTPGHDLNAEANQDSLITSLALLRALAKVGCRRVLMAGTCVEYDTDLGYLSETSPTRPRTLYAAAKLALQTYAERYVRLVDLDLVWLRFFYLHGPYEDKRRLVPQVVLRLLSGQPAPITAGHQIKDYLHVEDVASAVWAAAQSPLTGIVNIGSGQPVSVREVVTTIAQRLERMALIQFGALPYAEHDPMFICANNAKLTQHTTWRPRYDLTEGLFQTIAWWQSAAGRA